MFDKVYSWQTIAFTPMGMTFSRVKDCSKEIIMADIHQIMAKIELILAIISSSTLYI